MAFGLDLGNLIVHLNADISHYSANMRRAKGIMKSTAMTLTRVGTRLSLAVTAPLVGIGIAGVRSFGAFDKAMTESLSIMKGVTPQLRKEMEELAITISERTSTSAVSLAEAYYFLASAGLSAEASMAALSATNDFAIAGAFDMAKATDLATDAQQALRLGSDDAEENLRSLIHVMDNVATAAQNSNDTIQGFSEMLTADASAAAVSYGMELETTMAVLSAYAAQGKKNSEAGNLMARGVRLVTKASRENSAEWERRGIPIIDKATGEYRRYIDVVGDMEKALGKLTKPARDQALSMMGFRALALKSILPLIGMTEQMKAFREEQLKAAGAIKQITDKQMKAFYNQLLITKNRVTSLAREIGSVLAPYILKLNEFIARLTIKWRQLEPGTKRIIVLMGVIAAAAGPALIMLGLMAGGVSAIIGLLGALSGSLGIAAVAAGALVVAFKRDSIADYLTSEFLIVDQMANALATSLLVLWENIKAGFKEMGAIISHVFFGIVDGIAAAIGWLLGKFAALGQEGGGSSAVNKMFEALTGKNADELQAMAQGLKDYKGNEGSLSSRLSGIKAETDAQIAAYKEASTELHVEAEARHAAKKAEEQSEVDRMIENMMAWLKKFTKVTLPGVADEFDVAETALTAVATGSEVGRGLSIAALSSGSDQQLDMLQKQLDEQKKSNTHLNNIETNTEWG